jgi:hypothetical protein
VENPFKQDAQVEVSTTSGMLRVAVHPKTHWLLMFVSAASIFIFGVFLYRAWAATPPLSRGLSLLAVVSAVVAWFYQLSESEVIEIDSQALTIRKNVLGWDRTSIYPTRDCGELQWREHSEDDHFGLQCKVGWKTIRFGDVSEDKAVEILTILQRDLPDIAQAMLVSPDSSKKHFTTLGLS